MRAPASCSSRWRARTGGRTTACASPSRWARSRSARSPTGTSARWSGPRTPHAGARRVFEQPAPTAPMQRYVTAARGERGLTVLTDGLPEYEIQDRRGDPGHAPPRLRADVARGLPERPGHAGWPTPTPDAQCLGPFHARLGVFPVEEPELDARGADRADGGALPRAAAGPDAALAAGDAGAGRRAVAGGQRPRLRGDEAGGNGEGHCRALLQRTADAGRRGVARAVARAVGRAGAARRDAPRARSRSGPTA